MIRFGSIEMASIESFTCQSFQVFVGLPQLYSRRICFQNVLLYSSWGLLEEHIPQLVMTVSLNRIQYIRISLDKPVPRYNSVARRFGLGAMKNE